MQAGWLNMCGQICSRIKGHSSLIRTITVAASFFSLASFVIYKKCTRRQAQRKKQEQERDSKRFENFCNQQKWAQNQTASYYTIQIQCIDDVRDIDFSAVDTDFLEAKKVFVFISCNYSQHSIPAIRVQYDKKEQRLALYEVVQHGDHYSWQESQHTELNSLLKQKFISQVSIDQKIEDEKESFLDIDFPVEIFDEDPTAKLRSLIQKNNIAGNNFTWKCLTLQRVQEVSRDIREGQKKVLLFDASALADQMCQQDPMLHMKHHKNCGLFYILIKQDATQNYVLSCYKHVHTSTEIVKKVTDVLALRSNELIVFSK